jgi:hypothetical protein
MFLSPLFNRKEADSLIMTYCYHTADWMFHNAMQKIVEAPLTLTLITLKQSLYTQQLYAMNEIHSYDNHYCVCMYYCLYKGVLLPLNV